MSLQIIFNRKIAIRNLQRRSQALGRQAVAMQQLGKALGSKQNPPWNPS